MRACFFDPEGHEVYLAFAQHWGFTSLPTQPRTPQENGKQERSGGYVKGNALKGLTFDSLDAQNAFLRHWNRTIARLRIHGTTRRQVWTHFVEVEQQALQPIARAAFPFFTAGERTVHTDGAALAARGVRAIRLIQGVLALTRRHPRVLAAVTEAHVHQHFRYQTIRRLVERTPVPPRPTLVTDDPAIRPMTQYTLEDFLR